MLKKQAWLMSLSLMMGLSQGLPQKLTIGGGVKAPCTLHALSIYTT